MHININNQQDKQKKHAERNYIQRKVLELNGSLQHSGVLQQIYLVLSKRCYTIYMLYNGDAIPHL